MVKYQYAITKYITEEVYLISQWISIKLPLNYECIIAEDDSVRLLSQFVEEMDLRPIFYL